MAPAGRPGELGQGGRGASECREPQTETAKQDKGEQRIAEACREGSSRPFCGAVQVCEGALGPGKPAKAYRECCPTLTCSHRPGGRTSQVLRPLIPESRRGLASAGAKSALRGPLLCCQRTETKGMIGKDQIVSFLLKKKIFYLFIHERQRERGRDTGRGRSRLLQQAR